MKKPDFRLEKVLQYRKSKETEAQKLLKTALIKQEAEKKKLEFLQQEKNRTTAKSEHTESLNVQKKISQDRYLMYLNDCISQQSEKVDTENRRVQNERESVKEKRKDRKILATLKEKEEQTFEKTQRQKEQKKLDEMAVSRFFQTT